MSGLPLKGEHGNTWTHFVGGLFALSCIWMAWPAVSRSWQMAFGVIFFICGMFMMFFCSTYYHWQHPGRAKRVLRKLDHISIYVMIASSYTPILVGVVGGALGWTIFGIQWAVVLGGIFYKVYAIDRWPRLSLGIYLFMGWCVVLVAEPVFSRMHISSIVFLVSEGLFYTAGTYFFAHDSRPHYHAIWHIFVLLGAMAHCLTVISIIL